MNPSITASRIDELVDRLSEEGRPSEAELVRSMASALGLHPQRAAAASAARIRAPQDPTLWPPSLDAAAVEELIDARCGCSGNYDCDCMSVFNQTRAQAWWDHNTAAEAPAPLRSR